MEMNWGKLVLGAMALAMATPALADEHMVCKLSGELSLTKGGKMELQKTLRFSLDDSAQHLVAENRDTVPDFDVNTITYTNLNIVADISDGATNGKQLFGVVTNGHSRLAINRKSGGAGLLAGVSGGGVISLFGQCDDAPAP